MTSSFRRATARVFGLAGLPAVAFVLASAFAAPASATVTVRVQARPATAPIQAFVTVSDQTGPVAGLTAANFSIKIDNMLISIMDSNITLPPAQDVSQRVSVVFVMDYSSSVLDVARAEMESSVIAFIGSMNDGDYAAVVKFNDTNPMRASLVQPFTEINQASGNPTLVAAVHQNYPGDGTNLLDALDVALNHMLNPMVTLPKGPKAIILVSDGADNESQIEASDVFQLANANSIPIFTVGIGDLSLPGAEGLLIDLASETGGDYFPAPDAGQIAAAYAEISNRLNNEYVISIPNGISDCAEHDLEVTVNPQAAVHVLFTRRVCDTEPDPFDFTSQSGVDPSEDVVSNTETITGLEVPAHISIISGAYSIGCNGTFTNSPGTISNGQTVCVGQRASPQPSTSKTTTLTIGGVAGTFTTTTRAAHGSGHGGGGGAVGLFELLFGLGALLLGRRRTTA